jgi:hypothetical protein
MTSSVAAAYLEQLQKDFFARTGADPAFLSIDDLGTGIYAEVAAEIQAAMGINGSVDEFLIEPRAYLQEAMNARHTRYEDPLWFALMTGLSDELERAAARLGMRLGPRPVFGTLGLGQFNALAIRVPDTSEHVIVFQRGVFGFINLITKALAASLPPQLEADGRKVSFDVGIDAVRDHLGRDAEPIQRFGDFLFMYLVAGDPHAAEQYVLHGPALALANIWRNCGELFILGHERGHIAAGHFDAAADVQRTLGTSTVGEVPLAWAQEHQADYYGMVLALVASGEQGAPPHISYAGISLIFGTMALVERGIAALTGDTITTAGGSHPPPTQRRAQLDALLPQFLAHDEATRAAIRFADDVDEALALLWSLVEPVFASARERGVTIAPIWLRGDEQ